MLFIEYTRPDTLVACVSLLAFVLAAVLVREYNRKRKSIGKKKAFQRPFIKRRSFSPTRSPTNSPASLRVQPRIQQTCGAQWSPTAGAQHDTTVQPGILRQVILASVSPHKSSKSLVNLATPSPPSHPSEQAKITRKATNTAGKLFTPSPKANRESDNVLFEESLLENIGVNVRSKMLQKKTNVISLNRCAESTADIQPGIRQVQGNAAMILNQARKHDSLFESMVHHSKVHEMEVPSHKANQTQLRKLQFCDIMDPFCLWSHECSSRALTISPSFWAHKCSSRFCPGSVDKQHPKDDNENYQDEEREENKRENDRTHDVRFATRQWSHCEPGISSRFDSETSNCQTKLCAFDQYQETDCSHHNLNGHSPSKARSCNNLSTGICNGVACNVDDHVQTNGFRHQLKKEMLNRNDDCKHKDGEYQCLNIRVSPKHYYSLGSLCDVSICGRSHLDNTPDEILESNNNSTGSHSSAECGSYNDTGYTSTEEIETESITKTNLDSASYDGDSEYESEEGLVNIMAFTDEMSVRPPASISELYPIDEYANAEWKGETTYAQSIKKGYGRIPSQLSYRHLRRVRGDNYCAIRAALFQAFVNNIPLLSRFPCKDDVLKIPSELVSRGYSCLEEWSFAGKRNVHVQSTVLNTLQHFLACFIDTIDKARQFEAKDGRIDHALAVFNQESGESEFKILEAAKLLMFECATSLHEAMTKGNDVPVFAHLLFARDTSENPQGFLRKHLNQVGDSGGLEQVEMCLLGYSLGLVIQVIRLSQVDHEDFLVCYPCVEDVPKYTPIITLIAEDDRHYNITA